MISLEDIIGQLRSDLPVAAVYIQRVEARKPKAIEVCYFFEIVNVPRNIGEKTFLDVIKKGYMNSQQDKFLKYTIATIEQGIDLITRLCQKFGLSIQEKQLQTLLESIKETDNLRLLVVERPVYKG